MDAIYVNVWKSDQIYGKSMWPIGRYSYKFVFIRFISVELRFSFFPPWTTDSAPNV